MERLVRVVEGRRGVWPDWRKVDAAATSRGGGGGGRDVLIYEEQRDARASAQGSRMTGRRHLPLGNGSSLEAGSVGGRLVFKEGG